MVAGPQSLLSPFHEMRSHFEAGSLEALLLLGTFIDSNRLVLHEPFNILVDKRVQALLRRYLKIDRRHLVWRLASDALIGYLGFP